MKNLKIRMKLILSFMLVLLFTVAVGVVGIFSITSLSDNTALLNDRANISILVGRMSENIQQQRAAYRGAGLYYVMENDESTTSNLNDLETLDTEYQASLEQLGTMLVTEEGQRLYGVIQDAYPPYVQARDVFLETLLNPDTSNELMMEDMLLILPPLDVLIAASNDITNFMDEMTTQQAETAASQAVSTTVMLIVILVVVAAVAVVLSLYISTLISKPLALMQGVLVQVGSTGNMNFTPDQIEPLRREAKYKDEIGQSIAAFEKTMERLLYVSARLKEVADGDLTADIELLTPQDTMGSALKAMDENLNNMFSEINSVAQQVATASTEIAQGAQSLAQGSTEQASTVQEISASINEITEQAEVSVQTANGAAQDSQGIRRIAQDGNEKMGRLSEAVQEMSDASQSIGNVIKVIDDIAFQTNILALNAAVEAARAGEHGKGFAVVADEVRNLAGKSAEAAKETSALISANIEKSTMGLNISNETAEALQKIVAGVEKTTESLNTISGQSQGAKAATEQVTMAVEQVAQVVQQNSATSEQSAAASQEMSSQAQVLQHLVTRFRLKERSQMAAPRSLPPAAPRGAAGQVTGPADSIIF